MNYHDMATRVASGDMNALREIYQQCGAELLAFARTLANGNVADAEDIVQECLVRVWQGRRHLASVRDVRAYLFTMVRNIFLNLARKESREARRRAQQGESAPLFVEGPPDDPVEPGKLGGALGSLPEEQKQVVILKVWGGFTLAQIAEILGVPEKTTASRYRYGLEKLKRLLGDAM